MENRELGSIDVSNFNFIDLARNRQALADIGYMKELNRADATV
jgi:hypothetical protein